MTDEWSDVLRAVVTLVVVVVLVVLVVVVVVVVVGLVVIPSQLVEWKIFMLISSGASGFIDQDAWGTVIF